MHLFRSRRQKGIAPPAPSEFSLHCAVVDTVKRWINPGWIFTHIASGEKRSGDGGAIEADGFDARLAGSGVLWAWR